MEHFNYCWSVSGSYVPVFGFAIKYLRLVTNCLVYSVRPGSLTALNGRFSDLPALLSERNIKPGHIDGVLMDTGASSMQFDQADRGFSISKDGPLDMRMDGDRYQLLFCMFFLCPCYNMAMGILALL